MFTAEADGGDHTQVFHQTGNGRSRSGAAPVANLPLTRVRQTRGREINRPKQTKSQDLYRLVPSWTFDPHLQHFLKGFIFPASACASVFPPSRV